MWIKRCPLIKVDGWRKHVEPITLCGMIQGQISNRQIQDLAPSIKQIHLKSERQQSALELPWWRKITIIRYLLFVSFACNNAIFPRQLKFNKLSIRLRHNERGVSAMRACYYMSMTANRTWREPPQTPTTRKNLY